MNPIRSWVDWYRGVPNEIWSLVSVCGSWRVTCKMGTCVSPLKLNPWILWGGTCVSQGDLEMGILCEPGDLVMGISASPWDMKRGICVRPWNLTVGVCVSPRDLWMGISFGFSGCTLASTFNFWVLGDDAASDCRRWHPLLLRLLG